MIQFLKIHIKLTKSGSRRDEYCIYRREKRGEAVLQGSLKGGIQKRSSPSSQEKATLERLKHPGIVKAYDFFEEDGFYYLVTEFIEGSSLDKADLAHIRSLSAGKSAPGLGDAAL